MAADAEVWQGPKLQHDAALGVVRLNKRPNTATARLPLESSDWGSTLTVQPQNMVEIKLNSDRAARFKRAVYASGYASGLNEGDFEAILKKS